MSQVEKTISNFIKNQFPLFYNEEGPDFILFVKAYYEWLESEGQPVRQSREIFDYRDIDYTPEAFLEHFQKKYLYGIPFKIIANKRFLLKHILDVYRSKGNIQCYRLLFKLIYNDDVEIYIPGNDVLRVSDGIWIEPRYLEVSESESVSDYVGKTVIGASSGTIGIVENVVKENFNNDIITIVYLSNITPKGGDFVIGERLLDYYAEKNFDIISKAPKIYGSLQYLDIINGGQNFKLGDVIKIAKNDLTTGDKISFGIDGILKVTSLGTGVGTLLFDIQSGGFGYTNTSQVFVYRNGSNGQGASFNLNVLTSTQQIIYNTDIICDYLTKTLDSTAYGFPANGLANLTSNVGVAFAYTTNTFGTIYSLTNIKTGNSYDQNANVFVRSVMTSNVLTGTLTYNTAVSTVTGSSTNFTNIFVNNDVIFLQANTLDSSTIEYQVIKQVVSDTSLTLYGAPSNNTDGSVGVYRAAPVILPAQYAVYEPVMYRQDGTINGKNEYILAAPNYGQDSISAARAINSGKAYYGNETVKAYLYGTISNAVNIINGGSGYTNGDLVVFAGGGSPGTYANAVVNTNSNGVITYVTVLNSGSGYTEQPTVRVRSANGSGAVLTAAIKEFNTESEVVGRVSKGGLGFGRGYWETTRGFLNSDKYIQDSYYYQDYSYEVRVAETLSKYKNILYNTFHVAGNELFGQYLSIDSIQNLLVDSYSEYSTANSEDVPIYLTCDSTFITADSNTAMRIDYYVYPTVTGSTALLGSETSGFAMDFTDPYGSYASR
jgi:hypothetical protein